MDAWILAHNGDPIAFNGGNGSASVWSGSLYGPIQVLNPYTQGGYRRVYDTTYNGGPVGEYKDIWDSSLPHYDSLYGFAVSRRASAS